MLFHISPLAIESNHTVSKGDLLKSSSLLFSICDLLPSCSSINSPISYLLSWSISSIARSLSYHDVIVPFIGSVTILYHLFSNAMVFIFSDWTPGSSIGLIIYFLYPKAGISLNHIPHSVTSDRL